MQNIFNLSLHRTGTQAMHDLFKRANVSSIHWAAVVDGVDYQAMVEGRETDRDFVADLMAPIFDKAVAINDAPISALSLQLSERHPSARFFALYRSAESWIRSVRKHVGERPFVPYERVVYWAHFTDRPGGLSDLCDKDLQGFHEKHHDELSQRFSGAPNFLMLPLEGRAIGPALCQLFGFDPLPMRVIDYRMGHDISAPPEAIDARVCE